VHQGRVEPVYADPTHGDYVFVLGQDTGEFGGIGGFQLKLGDTIEITQELELPNPISKFLYFDWRMRTPDFGPAGQVILAAGEVDFLTVAADPIEGVQLPSSPAIPFTENMTGRILRVSGATDSSNNGDWVISGVPNVAPWDGANDIGRAAILENPSITAATGDPAVTLELLGLWWHAKCFINGHLRAEVIEPAVQHSPDGWQRTDMAAHIGKMSGGAYVTLRFVLSLEPVALS
jgi:hypothetical protein